MNANFNETELRTLVNFLDQTVAGNLMTLAERQTLTPLWQRLRRQVMDLDLPPKEEKKPTPLTGKAKLVAEYWYGEDENIFA
jgi:hypothetical protein